MVSVGTWGEGPFENDVAQDWIPTLTLLPSFAECRDALAAFDASEWECTIAAAEVVASAVATPSPDLPDSVRRWLEATVERPDAADVALAVNAVAFIAMSEVRTLWPDASAWLASLAEIRARLESALPYRS